MKWETPSSRDGYTLYRAVDDVFGVLPLWPWSAVVIMVVGGLIGAIASAALRSPDTPPNPALGWAACSGYGAVLAAVMTIVPRAVRLIVLRASLAKRPAHDGGERPWWPLPLLAAALRGTPDLRRTEQDFRVAVDHAGLAARSILAHRLWPACAVAFVTPVLGLLSAWEAGKHLEILAGQTSGDILMQFVPRVSPPMVATIAVSLTLMVLLAILDQSTKGLFQRWAATVRFSDAETDAVKTLVGNQLLPISPPASSMQRRREGTSVSGDPSPAETVSRPEGPTVESLEHLKAAFSTRGTDA